MQTENPRAALNAGLDRLGLTPARAGARWSIPYRTIRGWTLPEGHPDARPVPAYIFHMIALEEGTTEPLAKIRATTPAAGD